MLNNCTKSRIKPPVQLMKELCELIDAFNLDWPYNATEAVVFKVPYYADGLVPERIEVERACGEEAIAACSRSFRAFSRPQTQHPGSVFRLPGYVLLNRLLLDEIDAVNRLKDELQESVKSRYTTERSRNAFYRTEFPGRVMLQVYRHIYSVRSPVKRVRFTWSPSTFATRTIAKGEAIKLLINRIESGVDATDSDRQQALRIAIEKIHALPKTASVVIRKPRSPYPIATLFHTTGRNAIKKMIPLSTPIFIGPGIAGDPVDIGELRSFNQAQRRRTRSDKKQTEVLFAPLYLCVRYD